MLLVLNGQKTEIGGSSSTVPITWDEIEGKPDIVLKDELGNIYRWKGSVPLYGDLPTANIEVGDVYDVQSTGMNYGWTGEKWDSLGMVFDAEPIYEAIDEKQDKLTLDDTLTLDGVNLSVTKPVKAILTQEEYDALPEEEKTKGLYIVRGEGSTDLPSGVIAMGDIPIGGIIMWSGEEIPDGWALCDGQNGTPDLSGKFVLGANADHVIGETGGEEEVTLTIDQMPSHQHTTTIRSTASTINVTIDSSSSDRAYKYLGSTNSMASSNTGGDQPHNNMPPYYVLAFIMKVKSTGGSVSGGGSSSAEEVYSTEETRIGTWIDGKPLYRMVVTKDMVLSDTANYSSTILPSATVKTFTFTKISGMVNYGANISYIVPSTFSDPSSKLFASVEITKESALNCMISGIPASMQYEKLSLMCILEYTKTTD